MTLSTKLAFSLLAAPLALGAVISSSFASASTILLNVSSSLVDPVGSSFVSGTPTTLPVASSSFVVPTAHTSVITIFPSGVCTFPGAAVETVTYVFGPSAVPTAVNSSGVVSSVVFATPSPQPSIVFASSASSGIAFASAAVVLASPVASSVSFLSQASSSIALPSASSSSVSFATPAPTGRPFHYGHHFNSTVLEIVLLPSACDDVSSVFATPSPIPQSSVVFETPTPQSSVVFETPTPQSSVVFETPTPSTIPQSSVVFASPIPSSVIV